MKPVEESFYSRLSKQCQSIKTSNHEHLLEFVKNMSKDEHFITWLNSQQIRCDEFFTCVLAMQNLGIALEMLTQDRRTTLNWFMEISRLVTSSGNRSRENRISLIKNVSSIVKPFQEEVQKFILSQTQLPFFYDYAHEIFFLYFFCQAGKNGILKEVLVSRVLESPAWMTYAETLSAIAFIQGPSLIEIISEAATKAPEDKEDLFDALEMMTGIDYDKPDNLYIQEIKNWYEDKKDILVIDTSSLYPAPTRSALFKPST